jgi:hypothetical protein
VACLFRVRSNSINQSIASLNELLPLFADCGGIHGTCRIAPGGRSDAATLLNQTPDEEEATDKKLTQMAEGQINRKAA